MSDFISVYENILYEKDCADIVMDFEKFSSMGISYSRQEGEMCPKSSKDDESIKYMNILATQIDTSKSRLMMDAINRCVGDYVKKYEVGMFNKKIETGYPIAMEQVQLQKTMPSQGYHVWHSERGCVSSSSRVLAWTLYLNDVEDGGETEFLYQSKRIEPKTGKLVIWPATFTHTHRGNPPLKGDKYIATGWYRYLE